MKTRILHPHRAVPLEPHQGHPVPSWSPFGRPSGLPKSQGFLRVLLEASWELLRAFWKSPRVRLEHQNVQFNASFATFSNVCSFVRIRPCPPQSCSRRGKATPLRSNKQPMVCSFVCRRPCQTKTCSRVWKATVPFYEAISNEQHKDCSCWCFGLCPTLGLHARVAYGSRSQQPAAGSQQPSAQSPAQPAIIT